MSTVQARRVCLILSLCLTSAATARAATLCATDSLSGTILLKTDADPAANAVIGLHGWLSSGTLIPVYGTAVVDAAGASMKIAIQGIDNARHQHLGIVTTTDLTLNGSGTFENINASRPFNYDITPVTWTTLDPCPAGPPISLPTEGGKALFRDGEKTTPSGSATPVSVGSRRARPRPFAPTARALRAAASRGPAIGSPRPENAHCGAI
jgi:hypothetical protein